MSDQPTPSQPEEALPNGVQRKEQGTAQPSHLAKNPALRRLAERLPSILSSNKHNEMWGVPLKDPATDPPTANVLIKFLRANEGDAAQAESQLSKALAWRRDMKPISLMDDGRYSSRQFGGLGYQSTYIGADGKEVVMTWNVYGGAGDIQTTFGDMDEFIKWRVALMELAVRDLNLTAATSVIPYPGVGDGSDDPYQMIQVHDYQNVRFLRLDSTLRATTRRTIEVFSMAYPELLREKFFVNVPSIMGWMFGAMKIFLSKNTTRKFHPITNGANLALEFPLEIGSRFPEVYGGKGKDLKLSARTVVLVDEEGKIVSGDYKRPSVSEKDTAQGEPAKTESVKPEPAAVTTDPVPAVSTN